MQSSFRELPENKELDAMEDIPVNTVCKDCSSSRRIVSRRNSCALCALVSEQCDELKKKLTEMSNNLDKMKKENEKMKETSGFIAHRENKTPLTILLFIANPHSLDQEVYDTLDKLDLQTQCMMLLHRNEGFINEALDKIGALQSSDKDIIKSVIMNYFGITKKDSMALIPVESDKEQFLFSVIFHAIDRSGRIQNVVTHSFWRYVHYLTTFMYDVVPDFERYISRYIPLKLPGSIIDDICTKYNYVFANKTRFSLETRCTLKDLLHSCTNQDTYDTQHTLQHVYNANINDDDMKCDDGDAYPGLNADETQMLEELKQQSIQYEDKCSTDTNDVNDDGDDQKLDPNADDFVPEQDTNKDHLCTIEENAMYETDDMLSSSSALTSSISVISPITPQAVITPNNDDNDEDIYRVNDCKYSVNKPKAPNDDQKTVENFRPKSGNRARSNFFISKEMISKLARSCAEPFDSHKRNDGGLVFDYFKNSAAMQINDGQMHIITTSKGLMVILNIDLHFKNDQQIMYLVAFENVDFYLQRVRWRIDNFMNRRAICCEYGIHASQLPQSSRKMRWFMDGMKQSPYNLSLDIISRTNFKTLKKKNTKRRKPTNALNTVTAKPKLRINEQRLKRFCQESWYNDLEVPAVVIKGKKQWIEWKKMIRIYDEYNEEIYVGISLRYHKSNKQWKIETIEYDAGRIFYQFRLVGLPENSRYNQVFNHIDGKVTRSLNIM